MRISAILIRGSYQRLFKTGIGIELDDSKWRLRKPKILLVGRRDNQVIEQLVRFQSTRGSLASAVSLKRNRKGRLQILLLLFFFFSLICSICLGLLRWLCGKESTCQFRRHRSIPRVGNILWSRKLQPIPISCLENSVNRGAWRATVHGITKSQKQQQDNNTICIILEIVTNWSQRNFV